MRFGVGLALVAALLAPDELAVAQAADDPLCDTGSVEQFSDVAAGDYGASYVLCMRVLGLSRGTGDGAYGADRGLTRGQMASFLVRLWRDTLGKDCPTGGSPFTDTPAGGAHTANIECLYNLGVTKGTTATTYGPQDPLTASQISRFLLRAFQKAGNACPAAGSELETALACLNDLRVLPNEAEGAGSEHVTRAQMAVYVIGLWHNLSGRGLPPTPPTKPTPITPPSTTTTQWIAYTTNNGFEVANADGTVWQLAGYVQFGGWSPDATKIAYNKAYNSKDYGGVWVVNVDGTGRIQLSALPERSSYVEFQGWSPDGTKIAYTNNADYPYTYTAPDHVSLNVVNVDGTGRIELADSYGSDQVSHVEFQGWSPDGTKIAYTTRDDDWDWSAWVANADGTGRKQITDSGYFRGWSPDGTRIAYSGGSISVWVANADGTGRKQITDFGYFLGWSPDGTRIAYSGGSISVWVANADGTGRKQITDFGYFLGWSPDGTRIAYTNNGVWVTNADGTGRKQITDSGLGDDGGWSPDGTRIAYSYYADYVASTWVVNADGTGRIQLTDDGYFLGWSPDGTKVAYTETTYEGEEAGGLWVVNVDGTGRKQLSEYSESWGWPPVASPS